MRFVEPQFPLNIKPQPTVLSVIRVKCWETYFQMRPFSAMLNVKAAGVVLIKDTLPWLWSSAGESWFNHTSILLLPYFPFTYFAHPALPPGSEIDFIHVSWQQDECVRKLGHPQSNGYCAYTPFALCAATVSV